MNILHEMRVLELALAPTLTHSLRIHFKQNLNVNSSLIRSRNTNGNRNVSMDTS